MTITTYAALIDQLVEWALSDPEADTPVGPGTGGTRMSVDVLDYGQGPADVCVAVRVGWHVYHRWFALRTPADDLDPNWFDAFARAPLAE